MTDRIMDLARLFVCLSSM